MAEHGTCCCSLNLLASKDWWGSVDQRTKEYARLSDWKEPQANFARRCELNYERIARFGADLDLVFLQEVDITIQGGVQTIDDTVMHKVIAQFHDYRIVMNAYRYKPEESTSHRTTSDTKATGCVLLVRPGMEVLATRTPLSGFAIAAVRLSDGKPVICVSIHCRGFGGEGRTEERRRNLDELICEIHGITKDFPHERFELIIAGDWNAFVDDAHGKPPPHVEHTINSFDLAIIRDQVPFNMDLVPRGCHYWSDVEPKTRFSKDFQKIADDLYDHFFVSSGLRHDLNLLQTKMVYEPGWATFQPTDYGQFVEGEGVRPPRRGSDHIVIHLTLVRTVRPS